MQKIGGARSSTTLAGMGVTEGPGDCCASPRFYVGFSLFLNSLEQADSSS